MLFLVPLHKKSRIMELFSKTLCIFALLFLCLSNTKAEGIEIELSNSISGHPTNPGKPRMPTLSSSIIIFLDGNMLQWDESIQIRGVELITSDEETVYSQTIPPTSNSIDIPSWLKGYYKIIVTTEYLSYEGTIIIND